MFRVGDRIRCIATLDIRLDVPLVLGEVYTVRETGQNGIGFPTVFLSEVECPFSGGYAESRFELTYVKDFSDKLKELTIQSR